MQIFKHSKIRDSFHVLRNGEEEKREDSWQLDQRELVFAKRLVKPEQKKLKKEVQQELTEVNYDVKDWYPIYSDTVGVADGFNVFQYTHRK